MIRPYRKTIISAASITVFALLIFCIGQGFRVLGKDNENTKNADPMRW